MSLDDSLHGGWWAVSEQCQRSFAGKDSNSGLSPSGVVGTAALGVGVVSDSMVDSGVTRTGLLFLSYLVGSAATHASKSSRTTGAIINLYKTYLWLRDSIPS